MVFLYTNVLDLSVNVWSHVWKYPCERRKTCHYFRHTEVYETVRARTGVNTLGSYRRCEHCKDHKPLNSQN